MFNTHNFSFQYYFSIFHEHVLLFAFGLYLLISRRPHCYKWKQTWTGVISISKQDVLNPHNYYYNKLYCETHFTFAVTICFRSQGLYNSWWHVLSGRLFSMDWRGTPRPHSLSLSCPLSISHVRSLSRLLPSRDPKSFLTHASQLANI